MKLGEGIIDAPPEVLAMLQCFHHSREMSSWNPGTFYREYAIEHKLVEAIGQGTSLIATPKGLEQAEKIRKHILFAAAMGLTRYINPGFYDALNYLKTLEEEHEDQ